VIAMAYIFNNTLGYLKPNIYNDEKVSPKGTILGKMTYYTFVLNEKLMMRRSNTPKHYDIP